VVATLSVIVDGTHVFREDEVPILELASQATAWLAFGAPRAIPFQYDSQEYTEILLAFYPGRDDYWRLSFAGAASRSGVTVARGALEAATRTFVEAVRHALRASSASARSSASWILRDTPLFTPRSPRCHARRALLCRRNYLATRRGDGRCDGFSREAERARVDASTMTALGKLTIP
jgi:hypothetical protein